MSANEIMRSKIFWLGFALELIYVSFIFLNNYRLADSGIKSLVISDQAGFLLVTGLAVAVVIFFTALFVWQIDQGDRKIVWVWAAIFSLTWFLSQTLISIDVFSYLGWGRTLSVWGLNPYLISYGTLSGDHFFTLIKSQWLDSPVVYGPIYVLLISGVAKLVGNSLALAVLMFKAISLISYLISGWLIYKITNNQKATLVWYWHPLILFSLVGEAHADGFFVCLILLAIYYIQKADGLKSYLGAIASLIGSVLVKYFSLLFLPLWFFYQTKLTIKTKLIVWISVSVLAVLVYLPFGLEPLRQALAVALSKNIEINMPPLAAIMIGGALAVFNNDMELVIVNSLIISRLIFILFYVSAGCWFIKNHPRLTLNQLVSWSAYISLAFFLTWPVWVLPWYLILPLALSVTAYGLSANKINSGLIYFITLLMSFITFFVR